MEIEPELAEAVLDQVAAGRIRAGLGGSGTVADDTGEKRIEAPYLQLVLERIWDVEREQGSSTLRRSTLDQLGGAAQIVAAHLERAMEALTPAQQAIASELFRQLVTPSGAKIAHAADDLAGYAGVPEEEALPVLETLAGRRILRPGDDGRYEIYHDVLAAPILAWRGRHVHAQELVEAHRRNRRLLVIAAAAIAALVVTSLVAVFALVQRGNARADAREAHARELDAAAVSLLPTDPELGLLLARDSAIASPTPTAEGVLRQALTASRLRGVVRVGAPLLSAAGIEDRVVIAVEDGRVVVAGKGTRVSLATGRAAKDASISTIGDVLLTGKDGRLWFVSGGSVRQVSGAMRVRGAEISANGRVAAVRFAGTGGEPSPVVRLVDVRTGRVVVEVDNGAPATAAAVSVGGKLLATGGSDRIVRVWRVSTGKELRVLTGHVGPISAIAFSARGDILASASTDGIGRVWDAVTGQPVSVLSGHTNYLTDIAFSPDGEQVVTASLDRTARTWKAETGEALATYAGDTEAVTSGSFTASGLEIVTASEDGTARTWDVVVQPILPVVTTLDAPVTRLAFVARGRALSAVAGTRSYRIGLPDGPALDTGAAPPPADVVVGPGGERAQIDGNTVTITRADGTTVRLAGHEARVTSVAFSADGSRVVTASADHDARIWDVATGSLRHVLRGHFAIVSDARFSPDGRWVVTAGPMTAGLWDATTGGLVYLMRGHEGKLLSVAFSPNGREIATGGEDGTVRLYECTICGGVDELVALADARLAATGRVATADERQRYGL